MHTDTTVQVCDARNVAYRLAVDNKKYYLLC